ncbi:response regulator transcription factor [uncultured Pseudoteredinibacter sp.]|uniref:response regulator transcription factor n=1 Tax=uncultured Pseudoteredinibacter sp. TaxID=1641701 RepID=UPI002604E35C|nr:response regulator transcription factor [uncultured Pseudoteredinibacter sp.]
MVEKNHVLVIEDDLDACELLAEYLDFEGFKVDTASSGVEGLNFLEKNQPDIVLLDIMMPQMNGLDVLKHIRIDSDVPVLMLTAKHEDMTKVMGFELGADDYLTKPYNPVELSARIKAILRRTSKAVTKSNAHLANLELIQARREVKVDGETVSLTATEYDLLEYLLFRPAQVVSKEELFQNVIGRKYESYDRTLDMHVSNLRKKIDAANVKLATCRGVGYELIELKNV